MLDQLFDFIYPHTPAGKRRLAALEEMLNYATCHLCGERLFIGEAGAQVLNRHFEGHYKARGVSAKVDE